MYKIVFDDTTDCWVMDGVYEHFVGTHLLKIAQENNITQQFYSESHMLHILEENGIHVELIEQDGSLVNW